MVFIVSTNLIINARKKPVNSIDPTMFAIVLLAVAVVVVSAADKNAVCCALTDLNTNKLLCFSNTAAATCNPANALADTRHANCCKTKQFSCDQYFIIVNGQPVASTCAHDNGHKDTDTDTDTTAND
jgi:hypothetical protein